MTSSTLTNDVPTTYGEFKRLFGMPTGSDFIQTFGQTSRPENRATVQTVQSSQTFGYVAAPLDAVPLRDVEYLDGYKPEVPRQAVTALAGAKRSGKSTVALKIAADTAKHGRRVLICQNEDPEFIVKARLWAMGADLNQVRMFHSVHETDGGKVEFGTFTLRDLPGIIAVADDYKPRLVIIDPLHALAKGNMNDQTSADCLIDLTAMAQRLDCAVVGVLHTGKNDTDVNTSVSGSDQWIAKCRSHLLLASPPDDDMHAVMQQVSASYAHTQNRWVTFEEQPVAGDDGSVFTVRTVAAMEPTERTVAEIVNLKAQLKAEPVDPDQVPEMARWMHDTIDKAGGVVFATDLQKAGKEHGYTANQLRMAYRQAGVAQTKQSCARPRSVLYLPETTSETTARSLGTPGKAVKSENSESLNNDGRSRR